MSKFLKFIVHFIVVCTIGLILAMTLPQFWGIKTIVVDDASKVTNLPLGSLTYAIPVKTEEVGMGTPILVQEESGTYRYNIASMDYANHTGTVVDPTDTNAETKLVSVKDYVPKVVITIGYVGYLMVATKSMEGMIVIGLAVLFLIILYVIAELWKKAPEEDEEELEGTYIKSEKELKREEKARERRMNEEDKELLRESKRRKKEEKKKRKIVKTGGFVDEIYEDEDDEEYEEQPRANVQVATSEAHELLKKEIAAATAEEPVMQPEPVKEMAKAVTEELPALEEVEEEPVQPEKLVEIKKMAIPVWTAAQLADKAKREGDIPDIVRDSVTKVTLFDYSDIIGGDDDYEEE